MSDSKTKTGKAKINNTGIPVKNLPTTTCVDPNCPYHGHVKLRGRIFSGTVISDKMELGATVEWAYTRSIPKYERYMRRKSKVSAHNPACIKAHKGDKVRIAECRPLSKSKKFIIIEKL